MIERDRHLFAAGPKRILSLDGGGVRGALTVAFLEKLEQRLDQKYGRQTRLADHFDLIGGTSTGAIIAGALALGYRTDAIKTFYLELAPRVFKRPFWRLQGLQAKFNARGLKREIEAVLGARTLGSEDLVTGFALVAKRMDTASPWIISNNPRSPYWSTPPDRSFIGNEHFLLANLVRASTAAPHYFDPEQLPIVDGEADGLFVDGGVTPHNNPSFALLTLARAKAFGLNWTTGVDHLTIVSIGTGDYRDRLTAAAARRMPPIGLAIKALAGLIHDSQKSTLALMQWLGDCPAPWQINSEIGTLAKEFLAPEPLFRFFRLDAVLEPHWLASVLDIKLTERQARRLWHMDDPGIIADIYAIGLAAADRQVTADILGWPQA
jgi:patatin-like phospholipase/acyl hydrolase